MKLIDDNGNVIRNETRQEIIARHSRMMDAHRQGMEFLESIHTEEPYFQNLKAENDRVNRDEYNRKVDSGLTTEINTSQTLVNVGDTMENIRDLFARHPYGFKDGDAEGIELLKGENEEPAALTPEKVDPYAGKKPILKNGKLIWVASQN